MIKASFSPESLNLNGAQCYLRGSLKLKKEMQSSTLAHPLTFKNKKVLPFQIRAHLLCPPKPTHTFPNALALPHSAAL